ncbi:MAG: L-alanine exporter AlaE [Desulfobacteraceae bacterium]|nr:L-alanine exporter AlaE [Desulfobacteraceae bacterium]
MGFETVSQTKMHCVADTFSLVTFAFAVGMAIEVLLSGLTISQSMHSRLMAIPLNAVVARPYGVYRDWLFSRCSDRGRALRVLLDVFAFTTFMMPQYALVLWWVGAEGAQILSACLSVLLLSLVIGRPYGLYLVMCRNLLHHWIRRRI